MDAREPSTLASSHTEACAARVGYLGLSILCHPDLRRVGQTARLFDVGARGTAKLSRGEPVFRNVAGTSHGPLESARVSRLGLRLVASDDGSLRVEVPPELDVLIDERPIDGTHLCSGDDLTRGVLLRLGKYVLLRLGHFEDAPPPEVLPELIGASTAMRELRQEILRVADLDVPVMLRGETGVGKELVASALHALGSRRRGPYVCVNMAAIPPSMAAAELFGHGKGAFTGAAEARSGYFVDADHGTLFLDEIAEASPEVQPVLLRAIESGVIQPLGGKLRSVDVRIVAATDADLESAVADGGFHAALLRRFGYEIRIPPLRERRHDVPQLFAHFLREELEHCGEAARFAPADPDSAPLLTAEFVARLVRHAWPGNVREVRNVARRFAISNRGSQRTKVDERVNALLEPSELESPADLAREQDSTSDSKLDAQRFEDAEIIAALRRNAYSIESTAADLRVSRSFLHARMNRLEGIRKGKDLERDEVTAALERNGGDLRAAAADLQVSPRGLQLQMTRLGLAKRS